MTTTGVMGYLLLIIEFAAEDSVKVRDGFSDWCKSKASQRGAHPNPISISHVIRLNDGKAMQLG